MCSPPFLCSRIVCGRIVATIALLLTPVCLPAQTTSEIEQHIKHIQDAILPAVLVKGESPATTRLSDRMQALHVPGVSIAVIHNGKIEWARGFGVTRIDGPAVTPATLFQAASISKPVTAMAVLHLMQSGKLDLDRDVNQYLKTWKVPENSFTENKKVTLRELISHTAGMTVHGFPGYASNEPVPTLVQILNGQKPANTPAIVVDTVPGTIWRYSGGGFVITQLLLQDVTGQRFPTLMHDVVLGPVGMTLSTYEQPLPKERMSEAAMPYRPDGKPVPGGPHVYPEMAPAGLWTTPSDLAHFAIELQNALAGKSDKVISAATAAAMVKPVMNNFGLGIGTGGGPAHPYFSHSGANEGFQCMLVAYNSGDGAVIMTNSDNGGQLIQEILHTIAYEYKWPDFGPHEIDKKEITVEPGILSRYVGIYAMSPGVNMTITLENGQLISQMTRQGKVPLFAQSEHVFFPKVIVAEIEFPKGETGPASQLILHQNGRDMTAKRLSDADAKKANEAAAAFEKRFKDQTPAPGSEAAVRRMIDGIRSGKPNYDLMSPGLADATRQQLSGLQSTLSSLGSLQSITFKGVGPGGADIYQVKFDKDSFDYRIWLAPDGKVDSANFRPSE
jgi:CubicO group peptidase (beta-lactamase class C family)